jgi:hypothetical protein
MSEVKMYKLKGSAQPTQEIAREDYYAPIPFIMADVLMAEGILKWPGRPNRAMAKRQQLSIGSVLYTLGSDDAAEGAIYLRTATDGEGTIFSLFPVLIYHAVSDERRWNWFRAVAKGVWNRWTQSKKTEDRLPRLETVSDNPMLIVRQLNDGTWVQEIPPLPPATQPAPQPLRSAPVDAWLDWRDAEIEAGRKVTLKYLEAESQWSESTFKKRSAERTRERKNQNMVHSEPKN